MQFAIVSPPAQYVRPDQTHGNPGQTHVVERGDTLYGIARQYGVPPQELIAANPQIANPDLIYPGDTVHVPVPHAEEPVCSAPPPPCAAEPPHAFVRPCTPIARVIHPVLEPPTPAVRQPVERPDGPSGSGPSAIATLIEQLAGRLVDLIGRPEPGPERPVYVPPFTPDAVRLGEPQEAAVSPWIVQRGPLDDLDPDIASRLPRADGRMAV
ncbi:LysM domain-containing protein [Luteimonas salinisoli]|uniref:LysM peptidoglycan-binding domain-containing protein n=1 Tax=Luteimonas salinisoli TaxID=2752307 RepID=UPI0031F32139